MKSSIYCPFFMQCTSLFTVVIFELKRIVCSKIANCAVKGSLDDPLAHFESTNLSSNCSLCKSSYKTEK